MCNNTHILGMLAAIFVVQLVTLVCLFLWTARIYSALLGGR